MKTTLFLLIGLIALLPCARAVCNDTACGIGGACTADPNVCTSCGTLTGLQSYLYPTDTKCYVNCPADSYKNTGNNSCVLCAASCSGCSNSSVTCISCAASNYRKINSYECTTSCGAGYYGDKNTIHCAACPSGCAACTMPTTTVTCSSCTTIGGTQYYL